MSDSKLKVLISGSVHGKLNQLFTRVNSINKKNGPFDLLLCVGDFFGNDNVDWQKCLDGVIKAPLQTYILGPMSDATVVLTSNSNGCELCENITYLGKKGLFTGSSGLKIAYLSGRESDGTYSDETITFSTSEAQSLIESIANSSNFQGVDILLSSQWPNGVEKYASPLEENDSDNFGSSVVSYVAKMLKPRYHFVSYNDILYERQPYRNHQVLAEDAQHVTRFISLSSLGNTSKKKWLYAFSITPLVLMDKSELRLQPPDVSEMPYRNVESKIETNKQNTNDKQYFYDMSAGNQQSDRKRHSKSDRFNDERKAKRQPRPQGPCWFCLSSPEVEKHLVLSVGTETYLALAKGFLVPSHVLITPIGHCRSTTELPPEALQEVQRYKNSLKRYYKSLGLTVVFFERNFRTSHLQIQCVPLPTSCDADLVKETFQNIGDSEDIELNEIPVHSDLSQIIEAGRPYFYVELQDGRKLLHRVKKGMPINFGREVLCSPPLLNMEDKIDWRKCEHTKDEETAAAAEFRDKFQPFDFSLD